MLFVIGIAIVTNSHAQMVSKPIKPGNSFLLSRQTAVQSANKTWRDALANSLKAKTDNDQKAAQRALATANSNVSSAESDLNQAQKDYGRQMSQYNRDMESYQKYLASPKK